MAHFHQMQVQGADRLWRVEELLVQQISDEQEMIRVAQPKLSGRRRPASPACPGCGRRRWRPRAPAAAAGRAEGRPWRRAPGRSRRRGARNHILHRGEQVGEGLQRGVAAGRLRGGLRQRLCHDGGRVHRLLLRLLRLIGHERAISPIHCCTLVSKTADMVWAAMKLATRTGGTLTIRKDNVSLGRRASRDHQRVGENMPARRLSDQPCRRAQRFLSGRRPVPGDGLPESLDAHVSGHVQSLPLVLADHQLIAAAAFRIINPASVQPVAVPAQAADDGQGRRAGANAGSRRGCYHPAPAAPRPVASSARRWCRTGPRGRP